MTSMRERADSAEVDTATEWRPIDPVDRSWSGVTYIRAYLDLDVPPADDVRTALGFLALAEPHVGRWMTATPARWRPVRSAELADWLERCVRPCAEADIAPERAFEVNGEALGVLPFRFDVGPNWISVHMTHAVADGGTVDMFVGHLLRQAASPLSPLPLPWTTLSARQRDLVIARDVLRNLHLLPSVVRRRRLLAGGTYEPAADRVDGLRARTVGVVSAPGGTKRLRELRDELFPGASAATVAMVGLRAAFAAELPEPQPGFECLFNTRPPTGPGVPIAWGNWSVGIFIRPSDDYSPRAVAAEIARVRDAGIPAFATASMRARARRSSGDTVQVAAPTGAPRLTLSFMQQHAFAGLVGQRPGRSTIISQTTPNGMETITVQAVELAGRLALSVAFYPDAWPTDAVERAARRFLDDPRGCLAGAR